jgi:hypothetical protein
MAGAAACPGAPVNSRLPTVLILLLGLAVSEALQAAPPPIAQAEINYLLEFVEHSGCEFFRNGTWYDAKTARAHLKSKYELLSASDRISSTEDFIDKAATSSSLSGRPYQVRCGGGEPITSAQWLREALNRYRPHDAPRDTRGALASGSNRRLVVVFDHKFAMDGLHMFGVTRNGHGLVYRLLASGATGQPHDSVLVSVDMNAAHAREVLRSKLTFDLHRNRGILHKCARVRPVGIWVGDERSGPKQRA